VQRLIRSALVAVTVMWLAAGLRADTLFVGDDGSSGIFALDTDASKPEVVSFSGDYPTINGLASDGKCLYASDFGGHSIVKFSLDGTPTPFATLTSAGGGAAFDHDGNLFVPYQWEARIDKISPDGKTIAVFATNVAAPVQLAFDQSGELFCADQKAGCIYKFDPDGTQTTFAKNLKSPLGLAFDKHGTLFAKSGGAIFRFNPDGAQSEFARLKSCSGLAFDTKGDLFASDGKGSIYRFEAKDGRLSNKPTVVAQDLGRNFFIAVVPGKVSLAAAAETSSGRPLLLPIAAAALAALVAIGIIAFFVFRKKPAATPADPAN